MEQPATSRDAAGAGQRGGGSSSDRTSARVLPAGADIVYRGQITVRVRNVARAVSRAEQLTRTAEGVVFSAETSRESGSGEAQHDPAGAADAVRLDAELAGPPRQGAAPHPQREDVTTEMADTSSRVRSQQRSVDRLRALLDEADTIGEVVQVESELAQREADLESLQAQLARLKDVTDLATIDVALIARDAPAPPQDDDDLGFLSGLRGGWDAFAGVVLVALTVLGALLPFAIALALVGVPAYVLLPRPAAARSPDARRVSLAAAPAALVCTRSTTRVSTSGSVSGMTPWPRLKTWPGAARPAASTARLWLATTSQGANSTAGSRLPCTARSGPIRPTASSSGSRKSTPTTSAPASPICPSSSPVPTPKWMRGTPAPPTAASTAAECGCTWRT